MEELEASDAASREEEDETDRGLLNNPWISYKRWIRKPQNRAIVELSDEFATRLLWWFPHTGENSQWRQVVWGILELQRLVLDLGTNEGRSSSSGTTVSLNKEDSWNDGIRVVLTAIQCLAPVVEELVNRPGSGDSRAGQRSYILRHRIEQIRFVLRLTLLYRFWRKLPAGVTGLQQVGGLFHAPDALSLQQEKSRRQRQSYVGSRTGRRVLPVNQTQTSQVGASSGSEWARYKMILGELLYIVRPVFLSRVETQTSGGQGAGATRLWRAWIASLGMDVASLVVLRGSDDNFATQQELMRRRMRLFLYLLRSPLWQSHTNVALSQTENILDKIPILGRLMSAYLVDWIYYWKVYKAEEG